MYLEGLFENGRMVDVVEVVAMAGMGRYCPAFFTRT